MRLVSFASMFALAVSTVGVATATPASHSALPPPITTRQTLFSIPFQIERAERAEQNPVEVQLYVSTDRGAHWQIHHRVPPEKNHFLFRAVTDGEYWFLIRTMRPRADIVARKPDGTLGGLRTHGLKPVSCHFVPVRFDGSLTFINVAYFEDILLEALAEYPAARAILVIGSGINEIDATGEEKVRELAPRLRKIGVKLVFSGLKQQVRRVFESGGLIDLLGEESFFADKERALQALSERYGTGAPREGKRPCDGTVATRTT